MQAGYPPSTASLSRVILSPLQSPSAAKAIFSVVKCSAASSRISAVVTASNFSSDSSTEIWRPWSISCWASVVARPRNLLIRAGSTLRFAAWPVQVPRPTRRSQPRPGSPPSPGQRPHLPDRAKYRRTPKKDRNPDASKRPHRRCMRGRVPHEPFATSGSTSRRRGCWLTDPLYSDGHPPPKPTEPPGSGAPVRDSYSDE